MKNMRKVISLMLIVVMLAGCATTTNVNINTNVQGAKMVVDGKLLGETPINPVKIKNNVSKTYSVVIEKEGYETYRGSLRKETKWGPTTAVITGYTFIWLLVPALLLMYIPYMEGPVQDQYFALEKKE